MSYDYYATVENVALTNAAQDLLELTASSAVPFLLQFVEVTTDQTTQTTGRIQILFRSTAGSGGTGVTPRGGSSNDPSAATTVNRTVTTPGTGGNALASSRWNVVVPYTFDQRPDGFLIPASSRVAIGLLAGVGTPNISMTVRFKEYK
jgi:hypothetical protein